MSFPRKLLTSDEEIIVETRPHWKAVVGPILFTLLVVAAVVVVSILTPAPALIVAGVGLLMIVLGALPGILKWRSTVFVLTNERIISRAGVVAKHSKEIPLEAINDVSFSQSLSDRLLGAGSLMIESAGEQGAQRFSGVRGPEQLQKRIYEASEVRKGFGAGGSRSRDSATSVADEIAKLAELRDKGILTDEEFEAEKKDLLA